MKGREKPTNELVNPRSGEDTSCKWYSMMPPTASRIWPLLSCHHTCLRDICFSEKDTLWRWKSQDDSRVDQGLASVLLGEFWHLPPLTKSGPCSPRALMSVPDRSQSQLWCLKSIEVSGARGSRQSRSSCTNTPRMSEEFTCTGSVVWRITYIPW